MKLLYPLNTFSFHSWETRSRYKYDWKAMLKGELSADSEDDIVHVHKILSSLILHVIHTN